MVDKGASGFKQGEKGAIGVMAVAPEVDSTAVVTDELTKADPDGRKVVVASGGGDEGGARGE